VEALQADLQFRLAQVEQARREVLEQARAEAAEELEGARLAVKSVREQLDLSLAAAPASPQSVHQAWLAEAEELLARRAERVQPPSRESAAPQVVDGPLLAGDKVWVPSLQASGEIVGVGSREVEVKIGSFRMRLGQPRVQLVERGGQPAVQSSASLPKAPDPGMELDLRGLTVDETLVELDRYLDTAYRASLPFVRLIHGKGTGALRQAVREQLRSHPLVSSYRTGEANEGGDGVTVARLAGR
jgi:DNA mismatch repair protein MutS2